MLRRAVFNLGGCEFGGESCTFNYYFFVQLELQRLLDCIRSWVVLNFSLDPPLRPLLHAFSFSLSFILDLHHIVDTGSLYPPGCYLTSNHTTSKKKTSRSIADTSSIHLYSSVNRVMSYKKFIHALAHVVIAKFGLRFLFECFSHSYRIVTSYRIVPVFLLLLFVTIFFHLRFCEGGSPDILLLS